MGVSAERRNNRQFIMFARSIAGAKVYSNTCDMNVMKWGTTTSLIHMHSLRDAEQNGLVSMCVPCVWFATLALLHQRLGVMRTTWNTKDTSSLVCRGAPGDIRTAREPLQVEVLDVQILINGRKTEYPYKKMFVLIARC